MPNTIAVPGRFDLTGRVVEGVALSIQWITCYFSNFAEDIFVQRKKCLVDIYFYWYRSLHTLLGIVVLVNGEIACGNFFFMQASTRAAGWQHVRTWSNSCTVTCERSHCSRWCFRWHHNWLSEFLIVWASSLGGNCWWLEFYENNNNEKKSTQDYNI